jgi:hypothetical protein
VRSEKEVKGRGRVAIRPRGDRGGGKTDRRLDVVSMEGSFTRFNYRAYEVHQDEMKRVAQEKVENSVKKDDLDRRSRLTQGSPRALG